MARGDARARWRAEEGDLLAVADHELHGFGLMGVGIGGEGSRVGARSMNASICSGARKRVSMSSPFAQVHVGDAMRSKPGSPESEYESVIIPSKLDVARSSLVSRCPRPRDVFGASTKRR